MCHSSRPYIFVFSDDTVLWTDAVVHMDDLLSQSHYLDFIDKTVVQDLLNRLHEWLGNLKLLPLG